ncbi:MAG TPA: hypothetical protein VF188_10340 [Longimicrobiales bacterium]
MTSRILTLGMAAALVCACAEEEPVGLDELVPGDAVRTVTVTLEADEFLQADTAITGFGRPGNAAYVVVAEDGGGVLDAHALLRFRPLPATVTYTDTAGTQKTDSVPDFETVEVTLVVDSVRSSPGPATLALYQLAEPWDEGSATWSFRVDTGAVQEPWTEPGGSRATLLGRAEVGVTDTVVRIPVDSAQFALLADTAAAERGLLIVSETPDVRFQFETPKLHFTVRPAARPDSLEADSTSAIAGTFVFDPAAPAGNTLLVGGVPVWRSFLRLKERLDTLRVVPCADGAPDCMVRFRDATVNAITLVLTPVAPPAGFAPADTVTLAAVQALATNRVPLARAPLGASLAPNRQPVFRLPPARFSGGDPAETLEIPLPGIVQIFAGPPDEDAEPIHPAIALITTPAGEQFGLGAFAGAGTPAGPRLRIVVSVSNEVQFQ